MKLLLIISINISTFYCIKDIMVNSLTDFLFINFIFSFRYFILFWHYFQRIFRWFVLHILFWEMVLTFYNSFNYFTFLFYICKVHVSQFLYVHTSRSIIAYVSPVCFAIVWCLFLFSTIYSCWQEEHIWTTLSQIFNKYWLLSINRYVQPPQKQNNKKEIMSCNFEKHFQYNTP